MQNGVSFVPEEFLDCCTTGADLREDQQFPRITRKPNLAQIEGDEPIEKENFVSIAFSR